MEKFLYRYSKGKIKKTVALLFPNSYSIGMSNLGFQAVYHLLQSHPEIHCERAFVESHVKKIKTFESDRELTAFDAVFITISFETDLLNILKALALSGIDTQNKKRERPFIIVGGIGTTILPFYLKSIADVLAPSDASLSVPSLVRSLLAHSEKEKFLSSLENTDGVYPYYSVTKDRLDYLPNQNRREPFVSVIVADDTEFSGRGLVEISNSCLYECAFCLVTKVYGDYRPFSKDSIIESASRFKGFTDKLGLVAATLSNHPDFKAIILELNRMQFQLSFSAFRIEGLDDELLEMIIRNENKTMTIAPETASDKLKRVIRKAIPNDVIYNAVRKACEIGIKRLKLYFIIGLPGETMEDIDAIAAMVAEIRKISKISAKKHGYLPEIIVDINPLVPKPFTYFEGIPMEDIRTLKKKIIYLKSRMRNLGRLFVFGESPKNAHLQYRIAAHSIAMEELIKMSQ